MTSEIAALVASRSSALKAASSFRFLDSVCRTSPATVVDIELGRVNRPSFCNSFNHKLILGGLYALVAMGYTLVYGILLMINFAHGEVMMIGGFAGYFALTGLEALGSTGGTPLGSGLSIALALLAGMLVSLVAGIALERIAYRPLRNAPRLVPLISAGGGPLFLQQPGLFVF